MKQKLSKRLLNIAAICALAFAANAYDLPTQTINGVKYYYYTVKKGETLYSVSHMLGISRDDIVTQNPGAADGLHADQILYFKYDKQAESASNNDATAAVVSAYSKADDAHGDAVSADTIITPIVEQPHFPTPVAAEVIHIGVPSDGVVSTVEAISDTVTVEQANINRTRHVAIFMPFMLNGKGSSKSAENSSEFYRGFLMGLDTLANTGLSVDINVHVYDTEDKMLTLKKTLANDSLLKNVDLIITPDNVEQTELLGKWGKKYKIPVLNMFAARDTSYVNNPYAFNANIPTGDMLDKAADKYIELSSGYKPVIIRHKGVNQDKAAFVQMLEKRWKEKGVTPITIEFTDRITESVLSDRLSSMPAGTKFAFIPTSSSYNDFSKYAMAMPAFRDKILANGGEIMLFGYPEWTTFRSDALKTLHDDNTVIYSRFYSDGKSFDVQGVNNSFRNWYGHGLADGVPSQGLMGYDVAHFVVKMLSESYGVPSHIGIQTTFDFGQYKDDSTGYVNKSLRVVRFLPGGIIEEIAL